MAEPVSVMTTLRLGVSGARAIFFSFFFFKWGYSGVNYGLNGLTMVDSGYNGLNYGLTMVYWMYDGFSDGLPCLVSSNVAMEHPPINGGFQLEKKQ